MRAMICLSMVCRDLVLAAKDFSLDVDSEMIDNKRVGMLREVQSSAVCAESKSLTAWTIGV